MPRKKTSVLEGNVDHLFGGKSRIRTTDGKFVSDPLKKMNEAIYSKKKNR
jgi:hypothetical protein